jgi:hypothetical protein
MRFTERSLFLGVDSLRLYEYLGHFRGEVKAMVDVATYVAVHQDIRVALGLAENMIVAGFFTHDPKEDFQRDYFKDWMPRLRRPFYLTKAAQLILSDPYLTARSQNLRGPGWSIDEDFDEQELPVFEKMSIERSFTVTNARWFQGTIRTNTYMKGRIAPGLIHPTAEVEEDRRYKYGRDYDLHRVDIIVHDPDARRSWYVDEDSPSAHDDDEEDVFHSQDDGPAETKLDDSKYDGIDLFAIAYKGQYYHGGDIQIEVGRTFEERQEAWIITLECMCNAENVDLDGLDCTLLQSTLTAILGADLVRLAYVTGESERQTPIICRVRFSEVLRELKNSFAALTKATGFWEPIPNALRKYISVEIE